MRPYTQASEKKHDAAYEAERDQPQNQGDEPTPDKLEACTPSYWHGLEQERFELAFPHVSQANSEPTIANLIETLRIDEVTAR